MSNEDPGQLKISNYKINIVRKIRKEERKVSLFTIRIYMEKIIRSLQKIH